MESCNSGESDAPTLPPKPIKKKRSGVPFNVILEPIGDFSKFETVVPLEDHYPEDFLEGPPPSAGIPDPGRDVLGFHASEFSRNLKKFGEPETINVKFDPAFRGESTDKVMDPEIDALIAWTRADNPLLKKYGSPHEVSDSETDELTKAYIEMMIKKKAAGWVTDEVLEYDESNSTVRNLHRSSISLTSYGETPANHKDFGNAAILHRLMSKDEKRMVGVPARPSKPNLKPYQVWSDHKMEKIANANRDEAEAYLEMAARHAEPVNAQKVDTWDLDYRHPDNSDVGDEADEAELQDAEQLQRRILKGKVKVASGSKKSRGHYVVKPAEKSKASMDLHLDFGSLELGSLKYHLENLKPKNKKDRYLDKVKPSSEKSKPDMDGDRQKLKSNMELYLEEPTLSKDFLAEPPMIREGDGDMAKRIEAKSQPKKGKKIPLKKLDVIGKNLNK